MNKKWKEEDIEFLKENYSKNGTEFCAINLDRNKNSVFKRANRLGLKLDKNVVGEINKKAQIKFQDERPNSDFNINIEQFLYINKKEVAYFLGFLWADGYIIKKRNEIRMEIINDDLCKIKIVLKTLGKWTYATRQRGNKKIGSITTNNKKLVQFLIDNDYENKSYMSANKILSKIPLELKHYFFRGLIDGDGCFYISKNKEKRLSISSGYDQDWSYVKDICSLINVKFYEHRNHYKTGSYSVIEFNGVNSKIFGDYIYKDYQIDNIGLNRKYIKYLEIVKLINESNNRLEYFSNKKSLAIKMYEKNTNLIEIMKILSIPSTTLRRWIKFI